MIQVFLQIQILSLNCLSSILIIFQCGMTVETKGWGLDDNNCSLSMCYLIPFCDYKSVGYGSHKNTFLKSICYVERKLEVQMGFQIVSFLQLWPTTLREFGRAYEITNFGRIRSFWTFRSC